MTIEEKKKRIAWRIARAAFTSCAVFDSGFLDPSASAVGVSTALVDTLEKFGCLDEKYGDDGSYEVGLAVKAMSVGGFLDCCCRMASMDTVVLQIFDNVRKLVDFGVCGDEIGNMRTVEYDREQEEIKRRAAEDAARLEKEREAKLDAERREKLERIAKLESEIAAKSEGEE